MHSLMDESERRYCTEIRDAANELAGIMAAAMGKPIPQHSPSWDTLPLAWCLACIAMEYLDPDGVISPEGCRVALEEEAIHMGHLEDESRIPADNHE